MRPLARSRVFPAVSPIQLAAIATEVYALTALIVLATAPLLGTELSTHQLDNHHLQTIRLT